MRFSAADFWIGEHWCRFKGRVFIGSVRSSVRVNRVSVSTTDKRPCSFLSCSRSDFAWLGAHRHHVQAPLALTDLMISTTEPRPTHQTSRGSERGFPSIAMRSFIAVGTVAAVVYLSAESSDLDLKAKVKECPVHHVPNRGKGADHLWRLQ